MTDGEGAVPATGHGPQEWLYLIPEVPNGTFFGTDRACSRFVDYRRAVTSTSISRGEGPLQAGFLSMRVGDILWLCGAGDIGIMGRGTVRKLVRRPEPWVTFALDRTVSRVLAQDPMPASIARRWLSGPINRTMQLPERSELHTRLQWWIGEVEQDDQRRLEALEVPSLRQTLRAEPSRLDCPSLSAFVRMLRAREMAIGMPSAPSGASIVACDDRVLVVASVVQPSKTAGRRTLESIGPLGWYGRSLAQNGSNRGLTPHIWLVFANPPPADFVAFLEDAGNFVGWSEGDNLLLGPLTKSRWEATSRVHAGRAELRRSATQRPPHETTEDVPDTQRQLSIDRGKTWFTPVDHSATATGGGPATKNGHSGESAVEQADFEPPADVEVELELEPTAAPRVSEPVSPPPRVEPVHRAPSTSLDRCTLRVRDVLVKARALASSRGHATVSTAHMMVALMHDPDERLAEFLDLLNVSPKHLRAVFEVHLAQLPVEAKRRATRRQRETRTVQLGNDLKTSFRNASLEAAQTGAELIDTRHLLLGVLRANGEAARELERCDVHLVRTRATFLALQSHHPTGAVHDNEGHLGQRVS